MSTHTGRWGFQTLYDERKICTIWGAVAWMGTLCNCARKSCSGKWDNLNRDLKSLWFTVVVSSTSASHVETHEVQQGCWLPGRCSSDTAFSEPSLSSCKPTADQMQDITRGCEGKSPPGPAASLNLPQQALQPGAWKLARAYIKIPKFFLFPLKLHDHT